MTILLVAVVARIYRLPDLFVFGPDQGRDALVAHGMLATGWPTFEGPITSGAYHRGPAYYYLLAIAYGASGGNPLGGVLLTIVLAAIGMIFAFLFVRAIAGTAAGLVAAGVWAVSPLMIDFERSQWNPQATSPFTMIALYAGLRSVRGDGKWVAVVPGALLLGWQMHEQILFLIPALAVALAWSWRSWYSRRRVIAAALVAISVVAPFLIQQVTHGFRDVIAMAGYILHGARSAQQASVGSGVRLFINSAEMALPPDWIVATVVGLLIAVGVAWAFLTFIRHRTPERAMLVLLAVTPLFYVAARAQLFSHYLILVYLLMFVFAGIGVGVVARLRPPTAAVVAVIAVLAVVSSGGQDVAALAIRRVPLWTWQSQLAIARAITSDSQGNPLTFRLNTNLPGGQFWRDPWDYALLYVGGKPEERRADLPTYSITSTTTAPPAWASYPAVTVDLTNVLGVGGWTYGGPGALTTASTPLGDTVSLDAQTPFGNRTALKEFPVVAGTEYLVSFEYRTTWLADRANVRFEGRDLKNAIVARMPPPNGIPLPTAADWTPASFIATVPPNITTAALVMSATGIGTISYRSIEVRVVTSDQAPGEVALHRSY